MYAAKWLVNASELARYRMGDSTCWCRLIQRLSAQTPLTFGTNMAIKGLAMALNTQVEPTEMVTGTLRRLSLDLLTSRVCEKPPRLFWFPQ